MTTSFEELYPNLAYLVESFGWIEMGQDDNNPTRRMTVDE